MELKFNKNHTVVKTGAKKYFRKYI